MTTMPRGRGLAAWSCFGLVLLAMLWMQRLPTPLPVDADPAQFSALRARAVLDHALSDRLPHRLGTVANARVRDRWIAAFAVLGLKAETRRRFVCADYGVCGEVDNVLVRIPGTVDGPAVLVTSHYDSVGAGPGASDAGAGVAALVEIARALQHQDGPRREVLLLASDGEEAGLLGAEAFVQEPEFGRVGVVVNVEARGTTGRASLFETQAGNAALIGTLAGNLPDPALSSLAYEIYRRMPNNTDYSVYRREGRAGANFAFIGGGDRYHTPLDDLDHLDSGSLQHLGAGALAATRALAMPDAVFAADSDRVYFDAFGRVWHWRAEWSVGGVIAGIVLLLVAAVRVRRDVPRFGRLSAWALLMAPLVLACSALLTMAAAWLWRSVDAMPMAWTANALALQCAALCIAVAVTLTIATRANARLGAESQLFAALVWATVLAFATMRELPGGIYLGLLPGLFGAAAMALWPRRPWRVATVFALAQAMVWVSTLAQLYDSLGPGALPVLAAGVAWVILPLAAIGVPGDRARGRLPAFAWAVAIGVCVVAALRSPYDTDTRATLTLRDIAGPDGRWLQLSGQPRGEDAAWWRALPATPTQRVLLPWTEVAGTALPLPGMGLSAPTVTFAAAEGPSMRLSLVAPEPESLVALILPSELPLDAIRVDGVGFAAPIRRQPGAVTAWRTIMVYPTGAPVVVDIDWPNGIAKRGYVMAQAQGVASDVRTIAQARDAVGVPVHFGDARIAFAPIVWPTAGAE